MWWLLMIVLAFALALVLLLILRPAARRKFVPASMLCGLALALAGCTVTLSQVNAYTKTICGVALVVLPAIPNIGMSAEAVAQYVCSLIPTSSQARAGQTAGKIRLGAAVNSATTVQTQYGPVRVVRVAPDPRR